MYTLETGIPLSMADNIFKEYGNNPLDLFVSWMQEAMQTEINDPEAMALATVSPDGKPQVRMVLLKTVDERGFVFYTNRNSDKGRALAAHPYAEANFHWKSLQKQIRISGPVEKSEDDMADIYFGTRSRASRLGAWASDQSQPVGDYSDFESQVEAMEKKFDEKDIPRPPHWGGYRIKPERMEFWIGHPARLHKRFVYIKGETGWTAQWLFP